MRILSQTNSETLLLVSERAPVPISRPGLPLALRLSLVGQWLLVTIDILRPRPGAIPGPGARAGQPAAAARLFHAGAARRPTDNGDPQALNLRSEPLAAQDPGPLWRGPAGAAAWSPA